jgi:hypothetical protein
MQTKFGWGGIVNDSCSDYYLLVQLTQIAALFVLLDSNILKKKHITSALLTGSHCINNQLLRKYNSNMIFSFVF